MTRASLRVCVMVGTVAVAIVACGGSDGGGGGDDGEGGESGEGSGTSGRPNAGNGGTPSAGNGPGEGGSGATPGEGGAGGDTGSAGAPTSATTPRTGTAIVSAGTLAKSTTFQAVLTLGEVPGGNTRMTSARYRAHLGFVGSVQ